MRVDVERDVRDEAVKQLAEQGLTIDDTMRIVSEQAAAGYGPESIPIAETAAETCSLRFARPIDPLRTTRRWSTQIPRSGTSRFQESPLSRTVGQPNSEGERMCERITQLHIFARNINGLWKYTRFHGTRHT